MRSPQSKPISKACISSPKKGRSIAITGKGGTGKTMMATLILKVLIESGSGKVLAIDADSAISLPYALGMSVGKTVSDIRREIIEVPEAKRRIADQHIRTVMTTVIRGGKGFDLLVMGRPEEPGCFCAVNDLLRYGIETLAQDYGVTIIDGEAGPEQLNRRVLKSIDTLLVVSDMSARSLEAARGIMKVAGGHGNVRVEKACLIVNRFRGKTTPIKKMAQEMGLEILGYIPEDDKVSRYDGVGRPLLELPSKSPSVMAARRILEQIL